MSCDPPANQPERNVPARSLLKTLANIGIFCFFTVGLLVAAGSFGLFGCKCFGVDTNSGPAGMDFNLCDAWPKRTVPTGKASDPVLNVGEMPPLPSPK